MTLSRDTVVDVIEAFPETGVIQVRRKVRILEDDDVIASSNHREIINQGDSISRQPSMVQAVCNVVWGS